MEKSIDVGGLINMALKGLKLGSDELKALSKAGIREYLTAQMAKYEYVNTFLHRGDKVRFDTIYYPLKICNGKNTTDFKNPQEFLDKNKYISIIGTAGSGKSTLVKYIFRQTLKCACKIPVLLELRNYDWSDRSFGDTVIDIITKRKVKPNPDIVARALRSGQFVFILDGFDEVYAAYKKPLLLSLDEFIDIYPNNNYIVTSRQETGIEHFPRLKTFSMCPLTTQNKIGFIRKTVSNKERRQKIIETVTNSRNQDIETYFKNPLLLSMFILVYENYPEIPARRRAFYRNVFDTLYSKHDGQTKNSFKRERQTNLQREDFESILQLFSFVTFFKSEFTFNENELTDYLNLVKEGLGYNYDTELLIGDLSTSLSIIIKDGLQYQFPHRSMQEYFCAMFINSQSPDRKKQIYEKLFNPLSKGFAHYKCDYLISLCEELDEYSVYRYCFKPVLQNVLDTLFTGDVVFNTFNYFVDMYPSFREDVDIWCIGVESYNILDTLIPFSLYGVLEIGKVEDLAIRSLWKIGCGTHEDNISCYKDYKDLIHHLYINGGVIDAVYGLKHRIEKYMDEMEAKFKHADDFVLDLLQ